MLSHFKGDEPRWLHRIRKLVEISISQLSANDNQTAIAIPLRLTEVFTTSLTYNAAFGSRADEIVSSVWSYQISRNYFSKLRKVADAKIPEVFAETLRPPTPMASSLVDLVLRPLKQKYLNDKVRCDILLKLFEQFISVPFTAQAKYIMLPALVDSKASNLNASCILSCLIDESSQKLNLPPTVWLLYGVVKLVAPQIKELDNNTLFSYLTALKLLTVAVPEEMKQAYTESEDEAMDFTEVDLSHAYRDPNLITNQVLDILNDSPHVDALVALATNEANPRHSDALGSLARICYAMLSCHNLPVNHFRFVILYRQHSTNH